MIVYLDSNIIIYYIEQAPGWGLRATAHLASLQSAGDTLATSDVSRMECRVGPLKSGNATVLANFDTFFATGVRVLDITAAVCVRAGELRATHAFKPLDALHLAAAIVHGCDAFLTNDTRLNRCTAIRIDVLP